jgi:hypothetical protein
MNETKARIVKSGRRTSIFVSRAATLAKEAATLLHSHLKRLGALDRIDLQDFVGAMEGDVVMVEGEKRTRFPARLKQLYVRFDLEDLREECHTLKAAIKEGIEPAVIPLAEMMAKRKVDVVRPMVQFEAPGAIVLNAKKPPVALQYTVCADLLRLRHMVTITVLCGKKGVAK